MQPSVSYYSTKVHERRHSSAEGIGSLPNLTASSSSMSGDGSPKASFQCMQNNSFASSSQSSDPANSSTQLQLTSPLSRQGLPTIDHGSERRQSSASGSGGSPRVVKFSMAEVKSYAESFHLEIDVVKEIVMRCRGDREAVVATLEQHGMQRRGGSVSTTKTIPITQQSMSLPLLSSARSGEPSASLSSSTGGVTASPTTVARPPSSARPANGRGSSLTHTSASPTRSSIVRRVVDLDPPSLQDVANGNYARQNQRRGSGLDVSLDGRSFSVFDSVEDVALIRAVYPLIVALLRNERSERLWLEGEERASSLRLWRTSAFGRRSVADSMVRTVERDEELRRSYITEQERGNRYLFQATAGVIAEESCNRETLDHSQGVLWWRSCCIAEFLDRWNVTRKMLADQEERERTHIQANTFESSLAHAKLLRHQHCGRCDIDELWLCGVVHLQRRARLLLALHRELVDQQTHVIRFESSFRTFMHAYEERFRSIFVSMDHRVRNHWLEVMDEVAERRTVLDEEALCRQTLHQRQFMERTVAVPLFEEETRRRNAIASTEYPMSMEELHLRYQYQSIVCRRAVKAPPTIVDLLVTLEAARRRREELLEEAYRKAFWTLFS